MIRVYISQKREIKVGDKVAGRSHRKLTAACQTKAKTKNSKGITGIISTIGFKKA